MKGVLPLLVAGLVAVGCTSTSDFAAETTTTVLPTSTVSSTTTSSVPTEPGVVFTIELSGGCLMAGPNCPAYIFYADGTVEHYRVDVSDWTLENSASIDPLLVAAVADELAATDLDSVRASLPDGKNHAIYDGVNVTYTYEVPAGDGAFSSVDVELSETVPLFAATADALAVARAALGPLDMVGR